jgi:hypothetical protein
MSDFCRDLSTTSCNKAIIVFEYSVLMDFDYSRVLSRTFIHCSARRIDSKLRATTAGYEVIRQKLDPATTSRRSL